MTADAVGVMLFDVLRANHGVAHIHTLVSAGVPVGVIRAARRSGSVGRPRRGWVASPSADAQVLAAVSSGGRVGCASQAARLGLWMLNEPSLHLSLPRHSGHAWPPPDAVAHWRGGEWRTGFETVDPIQTVIRDLADCLPREDAICALDSALNLGRIHAEDLRRALDHTRRGGRLIESLDGRSESGLESLVRLRLADAGIVATPQHAVDGIGRADLRIGDRLLIECDGRRHHDDPLARAHDRARDLALSARGYVVIRLDVRQILAEWPTTLAVIRALMARREHMWRAVHRRDGLSGG